MSTLTDVTDATFDATVLAAGSTVLVDFWAPWCGPCRKLAPLLEEIAGEHADAVTVVKLDVDANQATAQRFQVMSIPLVIVFKDGRPVKHITGARSKAALIKDLADFLS